MAFLSSLMMGSVALRQCLMYDILVASCLFITVVVLTSIAMSRPDDRKSAAFLQGSGVFALLFAGLVIGCAIAIKPVLETTLAAGAADAIQKRFA